MVGLGETDEEILQVMRDMREHDIDMLTIGQYLAPSNSHLPVRRYVHPDQFKMFEEGLRDGLRARGRRRDGAQFVSRGPAGAQRGRGHVLRDDEAPLAAHEVVDVHGRRAFRRLVVARPLDAAQLVQALVADAGEGRRQRAISSMIWDGCV
jgi:hypothetical protein